MSENSHEDEEQEDGSTRREMLSPRDGFFFPFGGKLPIGKGRLKTWTSFARGATILCLHVEKRGKATRETKEGGLRRGEAMKICFALPRSAGPGPCREEKREKGGEGRTELGAKGLQPNGFELELTSFLFAATVSARSLVCMYSPCSLPFGFPSSFVARGLCL